MTLSKEKVMRVLAEDLTCILKGSYQLLDGGYPTSAKHKARRPGQESWQQMIEYSNVGQAEDGMSANPAYI